MRAELTRGAALLSDSKSVESGDGNHFPVSRLIFVSFIVTGGLSDASSNLVKCRKKSKGAQFSSGQVLRASRKVGISQLKVHRHQQNAD